MALIVNRSVRPRNYTTIRWSRARTWRVRRQKAIVVSGHRMVSRHHHHGRLDMLNGVREWYRADGVLSRDEVIDMYTEIVFKILR